MKLGKELNQALKILLVFTVVTFIINLLQKLIPVLFIRTYGDEISKFMETNLIWLIVMLLIIVGLCMYIVKADGKFNLAFLHDPMIRLTSGLLILFEGIFSLSISIPTAFSNIISFQKFSSEFSNAMRMSREALLALYVIPCVIILLQVLLGLYLILHNKRNNEIENQG